MFLRYLLVSALALAVDAATLSIGLRGFALGAGAAAAVGYLAGMLVHYLVSRAHVFSRGWLGAMPAVEFVAFGASGGVGLIVTTGVVHLLSARWGIDVAVAKGVAVLFSFVVVYLMRASLVFRAIVPR